jgi:putative ABC transport system permease protein
VFSFFKLAARNLFRRKRRSILTGSMIFIGTLTMVLVLALSYSMEQSVTNAVCRTFTGNIQIHSATKQKIDVYSGPASGTPLLTGADTISNIVKKEEGVSEVVPHLRFQGIITNGSEYTSATVVAVDPNLELKAFPKIKLLEGSFISQEDGVVIGTDLAKSIKAKIGQEFYFDTTDAEGQSKRILLIVQGIFTAEGMGLFLDSNIYMDITTARKFLDLKLDEATDVIVIAKNGINEKALIHKIQSELISAGLSLRTDSWRVIASMFYGIIMAVTVMPQMSLGIILFAVTIGLVNTILMVILERTKEIGMLIALGTKRKQILEMFVIEMGILSAVSSAAAIAVSSVIILVLSKVGIPAVSSILQFAFGGERLYFAFNWPPLFISFIGMVLVCMAVTFVAAQKASKLKPIEALHSV